MATKWILDAAHSEITFRVRHMMISNIKGEFQQFSAEVETKTEDDFEDAQFSARIETDSVSTNNTDRDNHLKSADFFNTEQYPEITYTGNNLEKVAGDSYILAGDLTINGVTQLVRMNVEFGGINKDPWGNTKAGFSVDGKINRKDFGLTWNAALETGGVMVSDEVKLHAELQFAKQQ